MAFTRKQAKAPVAPAASKQAKGKDESIIIGAIFSNVSKGGKEYMSFSFDKGVGVESDEERNITIRKNGQEYAIGKRGLFVNEVRNPRENFPTAFVAFHPKS